LGGNRNTILKTKLDTIERFQAIITGHRKGSEKELKQLERYQYCHVIVCHGYTKITAANRLMKKEESEGRTISFSQAAKLVKESLEILGHADETVKAGLKYAAYENLMRLAKKAEAKQDYSTARLLINDANKLMGLDQVTDGGVENPQDYMQPDSFMITDNPKFLDVANKMIEVEWEEANVVKEDDYDEEAD
jgi:hypothetical protein